MLHLLKRLHLRLKRLLSVICGRTNSAFNAYAWTNVAPELLTLFTDNIDWSTKHKFMTLAIHEAKQSGLYPTVGAVIVNNNKVVGRGCRSVEKTCDNPPHWKVQHAEQIALQNAGDLAKGATIYVTLEPCAARYQGPTVDPAQVCSKLIPQAGIACVVIGLVDKNPMTCGKGLKHLQAAGIRLEYAYAGLEQELLDLVGDGRFGQITTDITFSS